MKKVLLVAAMLFAGMFTFCNAQDVNVNINNQDYTNNNDCEFKINGICSSEDIGGVDVSFISKNNRFKEDYRGVDYEVCDIYVLFTNYNSFPVTVLCNTCHYKNVITHNIVLGVNETKEIMIEEGKNVSFKTGTSVSGLIVRKLAQ
ncbi:MAG: hypothetical protein II401_11550 [Bacteroidales bacterium]|nr:hypothetical protein [Bacteroidales bacterium]